ncbi:GerAB/ArcD/ProY family transporter [Sediminibacillus terrae]|uniref:GerAB/ArcD/ProY family transporter n=1 Tax=Sediminibacillus terrae TaxID=1562106 RepID=UPI001294A573|nr:endospore germination permease [Sediminibacillus terrae]
MKITYGQMTALIMLTLSVQIYVFAPSFMADHMGQHLWISLIISITISMLVGWGMLNLSLQFPDKSFTEVLKKVTGKYPGTLLSFLYSCYYFILFLIHTQIIVTMFRTLFLPRTPSLATLLLVLILALYCSFLGIEVLARASSMLLILLTSILLFLIVAVIPEVNLNHFQPLLPYSMEGFWSGTLIPFAHYGQVVVISSLLPFANKNEITKQPRIMAGIFFSLLITALIVIQNIGVFDPYELRRLRYPTVELNTLIRVGEFLERTEIFLVTLWAGAVMLVVGTFFTISWTLLKNTFHIKKSKRIRVAMMVIACTVILLFIPNSNALVSFIFDQWVYLSLLFHLGIPLTLGLCYTFRRKVRGHAAR